MLKFNFNTKQMNTIKTTILTGLVLILISSCDVVDNNNSKVFTEPIPEALMTSAQINYAYFLTNADVNSNNFRFYTQQWTSLTYHDESNYDQSRRSLGNSFEQTLYKDVLTDLKNSKSYIKNTPALTAKEVAVQKNKIAIIEIQMINVFQTLVDIFGNVPYSEALDFTNHPKPKFDDAKTIYLDLAARLDIAINDLDDTNGSFGTADLIFNGNVSNWKKLANCIKLKMGLHLSDVDNAKAKLMVESAYASGLISNNSENALFQYYNTDIEQNPIYTTVALETQTAPTAYFVDELKSKSDPRMDQYFDIDSKIDGKYIGAPYAIGGIYKAFSHVGQKLAVKSFPGVIFDYSETCFLLADAANRGYNVGETSEALYNKGITASMQYWGVNQTDIDTYLARTDVAFATATGSNNKERIAYQLYIAYYNRGFEAWTEYRRLDYPILVAPADAVAESKGQVPVRNIYSHLQKTLNGTNYQAASTAIGGDLMTTKLFWDKN
jgi:hypothetical protein